MARRFQLRASGLILAMLTMAGGCARKPAPPPAERVFVSDERGDAVLAVDPATGKVVARYVVGRRPRGLMLSKDGASLYVAVSGSAIGGPGVDESSLPPADHQLDGIAVVETATGKVAHVLQAGSDPETFTLAPDGKTLFVSNEDEGIVSAIDTAGVRPARSTKIGDEPEGVAVTPDGVSLFVACEASDFVAMLDARSLKMLRTIPLTGRPRGALASADGASIYVSVESAGTLAILSAKDGSVVRTIDLAKGDTDIKPMGIVEAPGGHLFVTTGRGGAVIEVDPAAGTEVRRFARIGARPWGIGIAERGKTLITANGPSGDISLIDAASGAVRARSKIGIGPWGVATSSGGGAQ